MDFSVATVPVIVSTEFRDILDRQDGKREQDISAAREHYLNCLNRIFVAKYDQQDGDRTNFLCPAFERWQRVNRPEYCHREKNIK